MMNKMIIIIIIKNGKIFTFWRWSLEVNRRGFCMRHAQVYKYWEVLKKI